ncbi:unnamed protein product [Caenorhabditis sp. 36 PRJEB53466]|nr:unnamed protein product [Caenorhabditis sp. 36 PRJEB53466]
MAGWDDLSLCAKQEIIQRLEFRTRFRLRHVAKSTRFAVDSTPLFIPRVNLEINRNDNIKITVYLGIGKYIQLDFAKRGRNDSVIKSTIRGAKVNRKTVNKSKSVPQISPLTLAFTCFKTVTMLAETTLGAFEVCCLLPPSQFMDLESHLSGSRIRTQVLKFSGFADALFFFYVDQTYLLEVQGVDGGQKMITSTRKLRFRSKKHHDGYPENNGFDTTYCFSKRAKNGAVPVLVERAKRKGFRVAEPDPYGITWIQHNPNFFSYIRTTECGVVIRRLSRRFEPEDMSACEMRWTCPKHADPFDHWYQMNVAKNTDETAAEHMIPMIDGVCPVQLIYEMKVQLTMQTRSIALGASWL